MPEIEDVDVLIVGSGLSGLVAAHQLAELGHQAVVLDKGRGVGGRLATRRLESGSGLQGRADHGAQFFTVRSPDFANLVHEWRRAGIVKEWCRGFSSGPQGSVRSEDRHPRYCAEGGMNTIAKYLASTLDVRQNVTVTSVEVSGYDNGQGEGRGEGRGDGRVVVTAADGMKWRASVVLLSAPVPQSLALLDAGSLPLPESMRRQLEAVTYARCLALLVSAEGVSNVPEPGGVQLTSQDDPWFSFVADNRQKGISNVLTMTFHVHDEPSVRLWDLDRETCASELLQHALPWVGDAVVVSAQVHGWKFARPLVGVPESHLLFQADGGATIGFIGDAFGGAKVEGAALSGLSVVESFQ